MRTVRGDDLRARQPIERAADMPILSLFVFILPKQIHHHVVVGFGIGKGQNEEYYIIHYCVSAAAYTLQNIVAHLSGLFLRPFLV